MTPCDLDLRGLDKVGKKMEHRNFVFEIEEIHPTPPNADLISRCMIALAEQGMEEWIPGFSSQGTFFKDGDICFARTTIRRWV